MHPRNKLILEFWDRSYQLTTKNRIYKNFVKKLYSILLEYDIMNNDITTNSILKNKVITAKIIAKDSGIFAGVEEYKLLNDDLKIKICKNDGDEIKKGNILLEIEGNAKTILARERCLLNLLQRMSGIATLTKELSKTLQDKVKIAATRKTLWGIMDKKAVSIGGGLTHRLNLSDSIIIKDNHLKILKGNLYKALIFVSKKSNYIEVEVESKEQALNAAKIIKSLKSNAMYALMLDKITPKQIRSVIERLKANSLYNRLLLEASGNINPFNLKDYANCGVDVISMGYLTNSAKVLDMSLEIK